MHYQNYHLTHWKITVLEAPEKITIGRLAGSRLVAEYPDMLDDNRERDLNVCILIQIICENKKQDLEISLRMANMATKEMVNISPDQKEA